jgi:predicted protein tyrosine phosphatase
MTSVLFVCTGNIDRSPTAEELLKGVPGFEVRSAGTMPGARRRLTRSDVEWADRIFVMENHHRDSVLEMDPGATNKVKVLGIPDVYLKGDERLVELIRKELKKNGISI